MLYTNCTPNQGIRGNHLHLNLNYFHYVLVTKVPIFIKTAYLQAAHNVIKKKKLLCFKEKTNIQKQEKIGILALSLTLCDVWQLLIFASISLSVSRGDNTPLHQVAVLNASHISCQFTVSWLQVHPSLPSLPKRIWVLEIVLPALSVEGTRATLQEEGVLPQDSGVLAPQLPHCVQLPRVQLLQGAMASSAQRPAAFPGTLEGRLPASSTNAEPQQCPCGHTLLNKSRGEE